MLHSQLYTGIRFAIFGAITATGVSLIATSSTSVYADTYTNPVHLVNSVNNIRQFDYINNSIINKEAVHPKVVHPLVTADNQQATQPVTYLLNNTVINTNTSHGSSNQKLHSNNTILPKKSNHEASVNTTDYISAYLSSNLSTKSSDSKSSDSKRSDIHSSHAKKTQHATHSNIKALYEQVQNKTELPTENQVNIQKWAYQSRRTIQDPQPTTHESNSDNTVAGQVSITLKKAISEQKPSKKNALNRYSASLTGTPTKLIEPIMPPYNQGYQPYQSGFVTKKSSTNTDNNVNSYKHKTNKADSNQEQMQEDIRKQVIEQQEKLKKMSKEPNLSHNRILPPSTVTPYQLSKNLQLELKNSDLLVSHDTSGLRERFYIDSLNSTVNDIEPNHVQANNNTSSDADSNISNLVAQSQLTGVHSSRTDYNVDINTPIASQFSDEEKNLARLTDVAETITPLKKTQQKGKQRQLINKLMSSAYQNNADQGDDTVNHHNNTASSKPVSRCYGHWVYPSTKNSQINNGKNNQQDSYLNTSESQSNLPESTPTGWYHAVADYGYYDNQRYAELSGNVSVRQGKQLIQADKVTLDIKDRTAKAEGSVMFNDTSTQDAIEQSTHDKTSVTNKETNKRQNNKSLGIIGVADSIQYGENINTEAKDVAFASVPMQAHGYASKLIQKNDSEYNLQDVMFTTCDPVAPKWHLKSKNIDLNQQTGRGETRNTTLHIKDVPVFYLPYFNFPIDSRRTSGFLLPSVRINKDIEFSVPYYFNIAPNYDATVNTKIFANRNPMLTGEFRYLTKQLGSGHLIGSYLPNDNNYDDLTRNSLYFKHDWQSKKTPNLTAELQYNYVSDADYDDDFDYLGVVDNYLNLPHSAKLNYNNDFLDAQLKVEDYQSLDANDLYGNRIEDKDRPYARLPQLTVTYRLPQSSERQTEKGRKQNKHGLLTALTHSKLEITGEHDSAYFKNSIEDGSAVEQSGFRMYNKLSASYPYIRPWGYIEPQINLQHLYASYDKEARIANNISAKNNKQSVFVPQITIDTVANFEKHNKVNGYQLLSPRLKYSYAPFQSQNNIPNFNTRIASINYEQLYADSWFLGHDRVQDLHTLTPGVNYRYIDEMGLTRLDANIAQQFYLDSGQVTLNNNDIYSNEKTKNNSLFNEGSSGLVSSISTQPYPNLWLDLDGALKNDYTLNYITSQIRYQPSTNSQFSIGITERKQDDNTDQLPISAVTASAVFPINNNWRMVSQTQYDYDEKQFLDSLVGIDYEDCCVGFSVYGRRYHNDLNINDKPNQGIMAEVRLKGLSGVGSLSKILSQKIMGIDSVNTLWKQ